MVKQNIRKRRLEEDRQRNLRVKELLQAASQSTTKSITTSNSTTAVTATVTTTATATATAISKNISPSLIESSNDKNSTSLSSSNNDDTTTNSAQPESSSIVKQELFALRVSIDKELREELHLNNREKRGRIFIPTESDGCKTLTGLKQEIESFFRCLKKISFLISASLPKVSAEGKTIITPSITETMTTAIYLSTHSFWTVNSDENVIQSFIRASSHYNTSPSLHQELLKRPSLLIHIHKNPNMSPSSPASPVQELQMLSNYVPPTNLPNPKETKSMTMLSFYSFPLPPIHHPDRFADMLKKSWEPFCVLGRVYVAQEGVNAQMAVPTNVMPNFMDCCKSIQELGEFMENGINIDPKPLLMEEFRVAGTPVDVNEPPCPPFKALHIKVRSQVLADGLDSPLDWQKAGYDMPPDEWHRKINKAKNNPNMDQKSNETKPLLLDCRNHYETVVGRFDLSEPLNTENFRDSWNVLEKRLKDVPRDFPIMTYCTGGIRCVKVGAYLTQKLNFTNVSRLAGGIIAYDRTMNGNRNNEESLFKGTNYVFDGRVGRAITDDALGICISCGIKTNILNNCRNKDCHKRMVQCEKCRQKLFGACSDACKRIANESKRSSKECINIEDEDSK